jgi:hypothetical protein
MWGIRVTFATAPVFPAYCYSGASDWQQTVSRQGKGNKRTSCLLLDRVFSHVLSALYDGLASLNGIVLRLITRSDMLTVPNIYLSGSKYHSNLCRSVSATFTLAQ